MMNPSFHRIQVRVAHADPLVAVGLATVLARHPDIELVEHDLAEPRVVIADYDGALSLVHQRRLPRTLRPPQVPSLSRRDEAKVLVLTANDREHDVRSALEAGVEGYADLGCRLEELVNGVRLVARGSRYLSQRAAQRVAASMTRSALTEREREVLAEVALGKSNKAVGQTLRISAGTVKTHMKAILEKLGAATRTEAAGVARELGLIASPPVRSGRLV